MIGLVGGAVSSGARAFGHWISLGVTALMMTLVTLFIYSKSKLRAQNKTKGWWNWYGPTILVAVASFFILAEPVRHCVQDLGWWKECGDNDVFPRYNQTWNDGCKWSSSQYHCEALCFVDAEVSAPVDEGHGGEIDYGADNTEWCMSNNGKGSFVKCSDTKYADVSDFVNADDVSNLLTGQLSWQDDDWDGGKVNKGAWNGNTCHCTDNESMSNLSTVGNIFTIGFTYFGFFVMTIGVMWNAEIIKKLGKARSQFKALRDPEYAKSLRQNGEYQVDYVKRLVAKNPCIVFSKTTCPFCFKAKTALDEENFKYEVIELDLLDNGSAIQEALNIITGQRTVPNVFIGGSSIGGGDDTVRMHTNGELGELLRDAGAISV